MKNTLKQQSEELAVFELFMRVCGYPIAKESIKQQSPPKPDIFCKLEIGTTIEFELTNSIDQQWAQKMNDSRILDKGGFNNYDPVEGMILEKTAKFNAGKYNLCAQRFELLVYLGWMELFPYQQKTIPQFLEQNKKFQVFDRIWVFRDDQLNPRILWSMERLTS
jgi:hypothetical protein